MLFRTTRKFLQTSGLLLGAMLVSQQAEAQVQYQIEWMPEQEKYQVSLVSDKTYEGVDNITATAQVTIKVPTGKFEIQNLQSLQPGVDWEANSFYNAPEEAPHADYISFGLKSMGTKVIPYQKGVKTPLFSFENIEGCVGAIQLVSSQEDPFMPPNSRKANIGNQITVYGARGNAYAGNVDGGKADCKSSLTSTVRDWTAVASSRIYPSPATDNINLDLDWNENNTAVTFSIFDINGKKIKQKTHTLTRGANQLQFDIQALHPGTYSIEVRSKTRTATLQQFLKL